MKKKIKVPYSRKNVFMLFKNELKTIVQVQYQFDLENINIFFNISGSLALS